MLLSIIIPVYNVADYLQKCIDSVLANDCADCEIILVDDGSTDGKSPEICDKNAARHPDLIRVIHQENKGLGGARNSGLSAAGGEYVFFVDSDDTITDDALTILKTAISKTAADIYSFPLYSCTEGGKRTLVETSKFFNGVFSLAENPEFLLSLPAACARIWKTELFTKNNICFPDRVWYEDIRTTPKLFASAEKIVTLEQPLYNYLARQGSIMRSSDLSRNLEILSAFDDITAWFTEHKIYDNYYNQLCRLAIDHIVLAATVRVARQDASSDLLEQFYAYMQNKFPKHTSNPYINELPALHKLLLKLIEGKHYRLVNLLFSLKGFM